MRALRSLGGTIGLAIMVWVGIVATGAAQTQDQRQRARQLYGEAQALFESGQYAQAEASFRAAYQAVPNPVVLKAIAAAQEQQGNIPGSLETLRRYLAEAPNGADHAEVEGRIRDLESRPATVMVASTPPGAAIIVDGTDSGQVTPADVAMTAGEHTVALRLQGYEEASQTFAAQAATRVRLEMNLTQATGDGADAFGTTGGDGEGAESGGGDGGGGGSADPSAGVWATAGIAAAGLISGTVFGFLALSEQSSYDSDPQADTADRGEAFALVADISFGVAAAMAITSIVLYIVERSGGDSSESDSADLDLNVSPWVAAHPGGQSGGVAAQLRF